MPEGKVDGKEKILESSLEEFAEKGYDGARIDRIANIAGVNKALIYYYFKNKDELYNASINYLFQKSMPHVELPKGTVQQRTLYMLEQFIIFLHYNPIYIKIMDHAVSSGRNIFDKLPIQDAAYQIWMALYQEGVMNGELREVDEPSDYIISLLGACYFFYSHRIAVQKFYDPQMSDEEILQLRIRTMKDIVSRVFT